MNKTLTFEIPEEIYGVCEQIAARDGKTTEAVVLDYLAQQAPKRKFSEEELRAAREELMSFAGAADSGDPRSADNERIDEDLAREYASSHEEG